MKRQNSSKHNSSSLPLRNSNFSTDLSTSTKREKNRNSRTLRIFTPDLCIHHHLRLHVVRPSQHDNQSQSKSQQSKRSKSKKRFEERNQRQVYSLNRNVHHCWKCLQLEPLRWFEERLYKKQIRQGKNKRKISVGGSAIEMKIISRSHLNLLESKRWLSKLWLFWFFHLGKARRRYWY